MKYKKIKSFSKINIHLNIIKKLNPYFHMIETLVVFCNLYDLIYIKKINSQNHKITFFGKFSKSIGNKNTITKLLELLDKQKLINNKYEIKIKKNIPIEAGMGGGSMNAATVFNYLITKEKLFLKKKKVQSICSLVGSDVYLGINNKNKLIKSNGQLIEYKLRFKLFLLIVKPKYGCKTAKIYKKIKNFSQPQLLSNKFPIIEKLKNLNNDFEPVVFQQHPSLKKLKNSLSDLQNILFARMTGSGSTLVGYFLRKKDAKNGTKLIRKKYKKHWCILSKTI